MPVVPGPHDFGTGNSSSTEMNAFVRDPLKFLLKPPLANLRQTAAQSIPNGTYTPVTFDTEDFDTDVDGVGGHDNAVNNSRYTVRYAGKYLVAGSVGYVANATGGRGAVWAVNGSNINGGQVILPNNGAGTDIMVVARTMAINLAIGDYVELQAFQFSGVALNTSSGINFVVHATMTVKFLSIV